MPESKEREPLQGLRTDLEIAAQVRREITRIAGERYDSIREYIESDAVTVGSSDYLMDWPFKPGDYPWLSNLAKLAIDHGLAPELAGKVCVHSE